MNKLFEKNISISNYFFNKNKNYENNIINFLIIINNKKMKFFYINRNNDKDFKLRYIDKFLNKF